VVFARALETPLGVSFAVGVARQSDSAGAGGGRVPREPAAARMSANAAAV
jgi:hypothetical protein